MTLTATTFPGLDPLLQSGVIAVVRLTEAVRLGPAARALAAGGVGAVEVTLTTPGAIDAIADLASDQGLAGWVIGAGTVLDESAARSVIDAGARFVVSPALDPSVIRACRDRAVPCMPGAFTPTELLAAWRAGAPVVKLFPASAVGPAYIRDVLAPLPFLRLVPSGGVSLENAGDWIRAGAGARASRRSSEKESAPNGSSGVVSASGSTSWSRARTCAPCASCTTARVLRWLASSRVPSTGLGCSRAPTGSTRRGSPRRWATDRPPCSGTQSPVRAPSAYPSAST